MATAIVRPRAGGVPPDLGSAELPPSKSHAQRAALLAAGTAGGTIRGWPGGDDAAVLVAALRAVGVAVAIEGQDLWVPPALVPGAAGAVHLGENGTALRMLPVVVALLGGRLRVDGAAGLARRPLEPVWQLFEQGAVERSGDTVPFAFDARTANWPAELWVDCQRTSQAASGVLIGLALRCRNGSGTSILTARSPAAGGYLHLTASVMRHFGYQVDDRRQGDDQCFTVSRTQALQAAEYSVPPDASAAVFVATVAALHGMAAATGVSDDHPDAAVHRDLTQLHSSGGDVQIDLATHPDSFPALCVAAAVRTGATEFGGAPALRLKESDRIAAMAAGLRSAGIQCRETAGGMVVRGPWRPGREAITLAGVPDHRVVMALALLGTLHPVAVPHAQAVDKSWPGFWQWLGRIAGVELRS